MSDAEAFFASELQRLMALPLTNEADLEAWYEESAKLETVMEQKFSELEIPHAIRHFINDADIRAKDAGYRDYQDRAVAAYLSSLR